MLIEQISQEHPLDRLQVLLEKSNPYSPAKLFDTETDSASGDTILSAAARQAYDADTIDQTIEQWSSFAISLDNDDIHDRARLSIAHKSIAELRLVRAAFGQVLDTVDHSDEIRDLEDYLFGYYDPELYRAALRQKIGLIETLSIAQPELQTARAVLLDELASLAIEPNEHERKLEIPHQKTLDGVGGWLKTEFGDILSVLDGYGDTPLSATDLKDVFEKTILAVPALRDAHWTVEVVERKKNAVSTAATMKKFVISAQRIVKTSDAKPLVIHEVLGHGLKSAMSELLGNKIGANGTATYSRFEESFVKALEQCFNGTYDPERGINHYIATGMAVTGRQSSEKIAQVINSIKQIEKSREGLTTEKIKEADRLTGIQINRTFAGMTDVEVGIAHRQDINYLHGMDDSWRLLSYLVEVGDIDVGMRWLLSAKFNPFSAEDRELVNLYMPMPESLVSFFEYQQKNTISL